MRKLLATMCALVLCLGLSAQDSETQGTVKAWTLTAVPDSDATSITADMAVSGSKWSKDSKNRYCYSGAIDNDAITANSKPLGMTNGLTFVIQDGSTNSDGRNLCIGGTTAGLWLGDQCSVIIPDLKSGQYIKVEYMSSKKSTTRQFSCSNLITPLKASTGTSAHVTDTARVAADGSVSLTVPNGMYLYSISAGDSILVAGAGGGTSPGNADNPKETVHSFNVAQGYDNFAMLSDSLRCDSITNGMVWGKGPKIYVSPEGSDSGDGSEASPYATIQKAVDMALKPGTTIILAPGEYRPAARINIDERNGLHNSYNAMVCLDGRAVINCDHPYHAHSDNPYQGIRLTSSYWFFYHVDITNASDNGMLIERNKPSGGSSADVAAATDQAHDNVIDACNFYKNGDTGLQMKNLASYNYIINCDSYLNCDEDQGDADGFAPKISVGTGNYFFGCRAYLNSDDGWDVFYKKDGNFGDNQTIVMDRCISYKNGFLDENTIAPDGNGNGFKCGSDQGAMNVYLTRCLAVMNKAKGFDQNHNSGDIILNNCTGMTSVENGDKAYSYRIYEDINTAEGHKVEINNCIAINDNGEKDKRDSSGERKPGEMGKYGDYGRFQIDETLSGLTINNCEFADARPEFFESLDHSQLMNPRIDDQLPEISFAHIKPGVTSTYSYTANKQAVSVTASSDRMINTGKVLFVTEYLGLTVPSVVFKGSAPDLGAYETDIISSMAALSTASKADRRTIKIFRNGELLLIRGSHIYNLSGQLLH